MLSKINDIIKKIDQSKFTGLIYITISSTFTSISFYPLSLWPFSFVCLWPLMHYLEQTPLKKKNILKLVGLGFFQGILISTFSFHWVTHTMVVFGNIPWTGAILIFLLYGAGTSLRWVFFSLLFCYFNRIQKQKISSDRKNQGIKMLLNPYLNTVGFWGISEYFGWQLFPYYGLNLISSNLIFVQIADILGTYGGSLIWFLITYSFYQGVKNKKWPKLGLGLFVLCHLYGIAAFWFWSNEQKKYPKFHIGVVQGNTPLSFQAGRSLTSLADEHIDKMTRLSYKIVQEAQRQNKQLDLIVWPESSVPFVGYLFYEKLRENLIQFQEEHPIPFFINDVLVTRDRSSLVKRKSYNNTFLLSKEGEVIETYQKVKLLPFGEFIPLGDKFPWLKRTFAEVANFTHGDRFVLFPSRIGHIMPLICYEVILPDFVHEFYRLTDHKAQIFINVTNDSWFGDSVESRQHLELGRLRSIEFRLPMVRGVNGGISTWLDITGRHFEPTRVLTQANKIYTVAIPKKQKTFYTSYGYWLYYVFLVFFGITFLSGILMYHIDKKRHQSSF